MTTDTQDPSLFTTWSLLQQVHSLVYRDLDQRMKRLGTTQALAAVLVVLKSVDGPLPMARLARLLVQEPQSITSLVDRLEAQGLARRVPAPRDRRVIHIEVTPAGDALFQQIYPIALEGLAEVFASLNARELQTLTKSLHRLRDGSADALHLNRAVFDEAERSGGFAPIEPELVASVR